MARAASAKHKPYILDMDQKFPEEEQTIWYIRNKNNAMGNESQDRYLKARVLTEGGVEGYDATKVAVADVEEFLQICNKVENWAFSDEYLSAHPQIKSKTNELGFYTEPITDPELLADIVPQLPNGVLNELIAISNDPVRLDEAAKKNSNG